MHNPAYPDTEKTVAIDFDGCIHDNSKGYFDGTIYGIPIAGVREAFRELTEMGLVIIIYTTKARKDRPLVAGKTGKEMILNWLIENDLAKYIKEVTAEKPPAFIYIDDKGMNFDNWGHMLKVIKIWKSL